MRSEQDLSPAAGFVAEEVAAELPGLRLDWISAPGCRRSSPRVLRAHLDSLASRYRGASVVGMRTQPVPQAYRACFRQIGLDPDVDRVPSEEAALRRLIHGHFRSRDLIEDALLVALVETGVPVWALDGERVEPGGLGIRTSLEGEKLGLLEPVSVSAGRLVVADSQSIHGLLFGPVASGHEVTAATERIVLFSVGVEGVPAIHVEEALWVCIEALQSR